MWLAAEISRRDDGQFYVVSRTRVHLSAGNRRLMELVETTVDEYIQAKSRKAKSYVIRRIIDQVVATTNPRGGFVTKDPDTRKWQQVDLKVARDKVGSYLRDAAKRRCSDSSWSSFIPHNPALTNMGERHDILERLDARLSSDSNWNVAEIQGQPYPLRYQDQHNGNMINPMLMPVIGVQNYSLNQPIMNLQAQQRLAHEMAMHLNTNPTSPPVEERMKSSLGALAETFPSDDDINFDLEPRPIEDMIG